MALRFLNNNNREICFHQSSYIQILIGFLFYLILPCFFGSFRFSSWWVLFFCSNIRTLNKMKEKLVYGNSNIDKWKILKTWDFVRNFNWKFWRWMIHWNNTRKFVIPTNWWRRRIHGKIIAKKAKNQYTWNGFGKETGIQDEWENWDSRDQDNMEEKKYNVDRPW